MPDLIVEKSFLIGREILAEAPIDWSLKNYRRMTMPATSSVTPCSCATFTNFFVISSKGVVSL
jgi:hypothetical protein